jgi:hypothetical protein
MMGSGIGNCGEVVSHQEEKILHESCHSVRVVNCGSLGLSGGPSGQKIIPSLSEIGSFRKEEGEGRI